MKKLTILLLIITSVSKTTIAQTPKTSVFHRLMVYNDQNEIMLVRFEGTDIWVTPGFYQDATTLISKGLHDLADTYGMNISNPELKGIFSLRYAMEEKKEMWLRNIYHCKYLEGEIHFPENQSFKISEIKWLPLDDALNTLTHKFVKLFIEQTHNNPNVVSGGSLVVYNSDTQERKVKIIETFYPIFNSRK